MSRYWIVVLLIVAFFFIIIEGVKRMDELSQSRTGYDKEFFAKTAAERARPYIKEGGLGGPIKDPQPVGGKAELIQFCEDEGFANTEKDLNLCGIYIEYLKTQLKDSNSNNRDDEILDEINRIKSFNHYQGLWRMGNSFGLW
tara:strand:- start:185 stop:610 length:426 start_codon:yes stop_codon:yes gene_type:complete